MGQHEIRYQAPRAPRRVPRARVVGLPFRILGICFCVLGASSAADASVIDHWTFDETSGTVAHDSVGTHNGTLSAGASFVSGGISGNAVSITNGLVDMDNVPNPSGDFSVVAWVKTTETIGAAVAAKHLQGQNDGYFLGINVVDPATNFGIQNKAIFDVSDKPNPGDAPVSSTTVNDNQWHQLIAVYHAAGTTDLYIDSVHDGSAPSAPYSGNSVDFLIGATFAGSTPTNSYTGLVDDVQLYSNALAATNAAFLFAHPGVSYLTGDVNFDGIVNGLDITLVASNWLRTGVGGPGDANSDGIVNGLDISLIASQWLETAGAGSAAVPEPSTIVLAAFGVLALLAYRRRR